MTENICFEYAKAFIEGMFSFLFNKPVEAKIVETIADGSDRCVIKMKLGGDYGGD